MYPNPYCQIFDYAMNRPEINFHKDCHSAGEQVKPECPEGHFQYSGMCYTISINDLAYEGAEHACIPEPGLEEGKYDSRLVWADGKSHILDYMSTIIFDEISEIRNVGIWYALQSLSNQCCI